MLYQHIREEISALNQQETDAKVNLVMRYLQNNHDEDLTDDRHDYDRAMRRLKKFLPEEGKDEADRFSALCYERMKTAIRFAWTKGMQLCWKVHQDHPFFYPFVELSVTESLQLYRIERMPAYRKLSEEVSKISDLINSRNDGLRHFFDDIWAYFKNLEFEACRLAYYFGYLAMCGNLSDLDASFVEDGDFTLALEGSVEGLLMPPVALAIVELPNINQ